ncbi:MAG: 50S ribosomal protein L4 [Bacteroidota bacterium]
MLADIYKTDGSKTGEQVTLVPEIFEIQPNDHAIYMAVRAYLAAQRQGTHKTKTRGEVRAGGGKPWRQKHTGRARAGSSRSPLWRGGGRIFGPEPRDYDIKLPEKMKKLARKSALSQKARENQILVVEDFSFDQPKTKQMAAVLKALALDGKKTLLLVPKNDGVVVKSGRNIPLLHILEANKASTYDILDCRMLVIQRSAVGVLRNTFKN